MSISVVIPTYNSTNTIRATIDSVLNQTLKPIEILVLDDESTDDTVSILESYKPLVTIFQQKNRGVANARNFLCKKAKGDLIAFLDHDDTWHPSYIETQNKLYREFPNAVAFFTKHVVIHDSNTVDWKSCKTDIQTDPELINPSNFIDRYNTSTGTFYSMSFCSIPKRILELIGDEPFCEEVTGVDDCYLCNLFSLYGPVVYIPTPLVAYRVSNTAQSVNHLKNFSQVVKVFQILEKRYRSATDPDNLKAFNIAFALKRRQFGKILMGVHKKIEARRQFWNSLKSTSNLLSFAKSLSLLFLSYMPSSLQPKWPSEYRES